MLDGKFKYKPRSSGSKHHGIRHLSDLALKSWARVCKVWCATLLASCTCPTCYTLPIEVDEYLLIDCFLPAWAAAEGTDRTWVKVCSLDGRGG